MAFLHGVSVLEIDGGARPIRTDFSGVIGIVGTAPGADAAAFPLNTPVLVAGSRTAAAKLVAAEGGEVGTLPAALDGIFDQIGAAVIVVRVEAGADDTATMANVVGGTNAATGALEGAHALAGAESIVGLRPRILIAPGFTHQQPDDGAGGTVANPVVAELVGIAGRLRAIVVADGPNTTDEAALAVASALGSERGYLVDPWVKVMNAAGAIVDEPGSARVAGVIARTDAEQGFWHSPSNRLINGIVGVGRPIDFAMGDVASRANILNAGEVTTIIRREGFRLWGNRSTAADPKWAFLSVRRTADMINDALQRSHLWALDRNITKTYLDDVAESVSAYLRGLKAQGAILGGRCWPDPELNSPASIMDGKVWFNFDFTPPYPAESITFRSHLVGDYLEELVA